MRFLSVCSGIEAASVAWNPLGWKAWAFSEIEPFPCAVLAHHYPDTPNLGDMTKFKDWPDGSVDLLCGGTPCQSFSNAGLRAGLDDPRGQLMLAFGAIAARYRPRWLVWENVPGVLSSNGGRDFGAFLWLLGHLGYGFAYRVLDAQFVRVDGYARAVPQRRQRVFVVGCLGDWRSAAAVLLERESLRGDPAPRRRSGKDLAPTLSARTRGGGFDASEDGTGRGTPLTVSHCLNAKGGGGRLDGESETLIPTNGGVFDAVGVDYTNGLIQGDISGTLEGAQSKGNRGQAVIDFDTTQLTSAGNYSNPKPGDPCHPLAAGAHPPAIAFPAAMSGTQCASTEELAPAMGAANQTAVAVRDVSQTLTTNYGKQCDSSDTALGPNVVFPAMRVRRLTPTECERLQGFPDGYTQVPHRGKPAADGPRYKALGNSWAVNCAAWIGQRIAFVDGLQASIRRAA